MMTTTFDEVDDGDNICDYEYTAQSVLSIIIIIQLWKFPEKKVFPFPFPAWVQC